MVKIVVDTKLGGGGGDLNTALKRLSYKLRADGVLNVARNPYHSSPSVKKKLRQQKKRREIINMIKKKKRNKKQGNRRDNNLHDNIALYGLKQAKAKSSS